MESLVNRGVIHGVLDMTIAEIGAHLVGGLHDAGPGRLDAMANTGIPYVMVTGAADTATAKTVAKSVICSSLLKAAMFGADANWGRVLCAIGYSGADVDVNKVDVSFRSPKGTVVVCKNGAGVEFSEEIAKEILLEREIEILIELNSGDFDATAFGCDLTYDYVKINGDYRT
jgi:glutamate N-acetyltransferase/amino-acid N-acetyltransferase